MAWQQAEKGSVIACFGLVNDVGHVTYTTNLRNGKTPTATKTMIASHS